MASETPPQSRKRTTSGTDDEDSERSRFRLHTTIESQAARIERLMARVDKPIVLPERKEKTVKAPRDFVRNIQGSSAGAGSGEFHVYRALRRKEYERQKVLTEKGKEEEEQRLYHERLEQQKKEDAERTAKKREKRKKRQKN
ncbi:uncharacterized protein EV422DRAFT_488029, partial [Fimicolochytrium jonesii]|uniref:uncharacterized protein n=1 Tax=Fimicolochytrium jonesii TaxID=1396493 RepID=UPI0022FF005F